jgi:hypothetical protein
MRHSLEAPIVPLIRKYIEADLQAPPSGNSESVAVYFRYG